MTQEMDNPTIALLLAGGISRRFWPLQWSKPLVQFCGKTVLEHTCQQIRNMGIKNLVIVTNPFDEPVIKKINFTDLSVRIIVQKEPKGMADAVLSAREFIEGSPCLMVNAPDVVDPKLFEDVKQYIIEGKSVLVGKQVESYIDVGYLKFVGDTVTGIVEKPGDGNEPSNYAYLVFNYFVKTGEFCQILKQTESSRDDIYEKALTQYISKNKIEFLKYSGYWKPLKYPWHILDLMHFYLTKIKDTRNRSVTLKSNVIIEGPVIIDEGVTIFENTKIVGPCFIGKDVVIGNNSMIRESHIGKGSVIGFNSDVARSYIGENCWLHSNYVGDSILSDNVSMGAGTILANYRLDEESIRSIINGERIDTGRTKLGACIGQNVRIGVQTSIMPGVKIGENSFIGAGLVLEKNIPDNSFCMKKIGNYNIITNRATLIGKNRSNYKDLLR